MNAGLFITEKDARNYTTKAFINKTKNPKIILLQKHLFLCSLSSLVEEKTLLKHFQHIKTSLQLLLLLQKVLHEDRRAKCHKFPKFYGFKASTNSREYIFSVHPRSYNLDHAIDHPINKHMNSERNCAITKSI